MEIKQILELTEGGKTIFQSYDLEFDRNILNPLNPLDTKPSFCIYWDKKSKKYKFIDFGDSEMSGDAIDFVCKMEDLSIEDAIRFIQKNIFNDSDAELAEITGATKPVTVEDRTPAIVNPELTEKRAGETLSVTEEASNQSSESENSGNGNQQSDFITLPKEEDDAMHIFNFLQDREQNPPQRKVADLPIEDEMEIEVYEETPAAHIAAFQNTLIGDIDSTFKKNDVMCIKKIKYRGLKFGKSVVKEVFSTNDKPLFAHQVGDNKLKIYNPGTNDAKFKHYFVGLGRPHDTFIFGLNSCDTSLNYVILCGGMKDTLSVSSVLKNGISLNSETAEFSDLEINTIREHFGKSVNMFTLYDWDETGIKRAKEIEKTHCVPSLTEIIFKNDFGTTRDRIKDFADVVFHLLTYGREKELLPIYHEVMEFIKLHSKPEGNVKKQTENSFNFPTTFMKPVKKKYRN